MATSNINNLDALDGVANLSAPLELRLKAAIRTIIDFDSRLVELFTGQMAAEGFDLTTTGNGVGLKATVQSPTVKVEYWLKASGKEWVIAYYYVNSAWQKVGEREMRSFL